MAEKPVFTEQQIAGIVRRMRQAHRQRMDMLHVRRLLIDRVIEAYGSNGTGVNIPAPFDKSKLIIQTLIGDVADVLADLAAMVGANEPVVKVAPVVVDRSEATQRMDRNAGEEERLRQTLWEQAGGREKHRQVTRSQCWGGAGWYLTLPRDRAWGMPERAYYDDLSPEEESALKAAGKITPEPVARRDGSMGYLESGESYIESRKSTARRQAVASRSLFTLEALPPDVVYADFDREGSDPKIAFAQLEVPSYNCGPGSPYALTHHRFTGSKEDVEAYGLYYDREQKRIVGGVSKGAEPGVHDVQTWTYTIFSSREEVYCLVSPDPEGVGTLVSCCETDFGENAFTPAPALWTDSMRPGYQFASLMEKIFAEAPILNQVMTVASLITLYNGIPRWIIEKPDGSLVADPATGEPLIIASETTPGMDPRDAAVVGGTAKQLVIDAETIFKFLEFYAARFDEGKPAKAAIGAEGTAGSTAWGLRQMIEQQLALLGEPVDNHAAAVAAIQRKWGRCLRAAAERGEIETVYAFALPKRGSKRTPKGLIEFNAAELTDAITVVQSADTAQARIVKQQAGIERYQAGLVTLRRLGEEFFEEEDARQWELEIVAEDLKRMAFYGDTSKIAPNSLLYDFALALRGRLDHALTDMSPNYAIARAEQMAMGAQQRFQQMTGIPQQGGDMAGAAGIAQPGMGMPLEQTGAPGGGQVPGVAPAPAGAVSA